MDGGRGRRLGDGVRWFWYRWRAVLGVPLRAGTPLTSCGGRWLVGVTRCGGCGLCGARSEWAGWPGMAGVCPWDCFSFGPVPLGGGVQWGPFLSRVWCTPRWRCGGFSLVGLACADYVLGGGKVSVPLVRRVPLLWVLALVPVLGSYPIPSVVAPSLFLSQCWCSLCCCGGFLLLWCSRCPLSRGCTRLTLSLSLPLCRGPSLSPILAWRPGGGVVVGPGGL